ncbi:MAG: alpha/beta hydrolase [Hyphomicrobium sp.]|jgi:esterase/lipase superfamily enzyme
MSAIIVAIIAATVALAAFLLGWRATRNSSRSMRMLVRGGSLFAAGLMLAVTFLVTPTFNQAHRSADTEARNAPLRLDGQSPATAPEPAADPWQVVPVYFGTDRAEQPDATRLRYGFERGRNLELGRAMVTVPKSHEIPQIERPWAVRIPYFDVTIYEQSEDPAEHFTLQSVERMSQDEFLRNARTRLAASSRYEGHALIFVHGYNTSFDNAVYRTAQIAYDLKFDGAAFLYSWPSGGSVASYTYDRESAEASTPYMRRFLDLVIKETGAKSVSIIAHSMGNQPLLDVLKDMRSTGDQKVAINEVIFAAPDVDADNFANLAQHVENIANGVTLYAASNDRALIVSRGFWRSPRAGDVLAGAPLIVPGIETIDVTAASTDSFGLNHSGYAENNDLLQDIGKLILSGLRPPEERLPALRRTQSPKGAFWRYAAP